MPSGAPIQRAKTNSGTGLNLGLVSTETLSFDLGMDLHQVHRTYFPLVFWYLSYLTLHPTYTKSH